MVKKIQKKTLLFIGFLVGGIVGALSGYLRSTYSKDDSPILPTAHADYGYYCATCGWAGDGCGGCSGADSGS